MEATILIDDVLWNIFDNVTEEASIQNLSYCSKGYLAKVQAYFRGRYISPSRKCNACSKVVTLGQEGTGCTYHRGPSKNWMDFYDDQWDGWRFTGYSAFTCCGKSDAGCVHSVAHSFDKMKCKNCGGMFSAANKKGKNVCRYHPGTDTFGGNHNACFTCCKNTDFSSAGCTFADSHEPVSEPGVIDRGWKICWSPSGRKCAVSTEVGTFVFQYNSSFSRWTHTHLLKARPGITLDHTLHGILEAPICEAFSPNGKYLMVEKSGGYNSTHHFAYDLAAKKYIGPFATKGTLLAMTWTRDSRHVVCLMKYQEDHGPFALHTFDVQSGAALSTRTFKPSTDSFERKDLSCAYFFPVTKEPSTVSCRHPDLKDFAERWLSRDSVVFFEPYGNRFVMISGYREFALYEFNIVNGSTEIKFLKYRSSFIPGGCSPPIRTMQWLNGDMIFFTELNSKGRACEPQFYFSIYTVNSKLEDKCVKLDANICTSDAGDVTLFRVDPERNIYYYAQNNVLHVLDAKTCTAIWSTPLPARPGYSTEVQFNVKNRLLQGFQQGLLLQIPETRPEQPIEPECLWTQFFSSAQCFVE